MCGFALLPLVLFLLLVYNNIYVLVYNSLQMKTTEIINKQLKQHGFCTSGYLAEKASISRQGAHKILAKLVREKKLLKIGKTKKTYYIPYDVNKAKNLKRDLNYSIVLPTKKLEEDLVFKNIYGELNLKQLLSKNISTIYEYAFTEMLNNVIDHSCSAKTSITIVFNDNYISFSVRDYGVGIFNNIRNKYKVNTDYEALALLLKGKKTTMPQKHSGEGIFFTSKIADKFQLKSAKIKVTINNELPDIFIEDTKKIKGTLVTFFIKISSKKKLQRVFEKYTNDDFVFDKTKINIKLIKNTDSYISRSQARRLLSGLEEFTRIELDFLGVKSIGQGFADEVFRIYQKTHPEKEIIPLNYTAAIEFMIKRAMPE